MNWFPPSVAIALQSSFLIGAKTARTSRAVTSGAVSCTGTQCQGCRLTERGLSVSAVFVTPPQVMQDFDLLRGSPWHTWTCTHGWAVTGLVPKVAGGTPVHAVSRSHRGDIIAVADDFGLVCCHLLFFLSLSTNTTVTTQSHLQVKLYRYPCVSQGSKCKRYAGHSSKILNVRFTFDDSFLVSVGGTDYSVFQWSHVDG